MCSQSSRQNALHKSSKSSSSTPQFHLGMLLLLALVVLMVLASFEAQPAQALSAWRMRTDKKAMRNSLVRFGKRAPEPAYRPAGEAFVSAVDLADGEPGIMQQQEMRSFYPMTARQAWLQANEGWRE